MKYQTYLALVGAASAVSIRKKDADDYSDAMGLNGKGWSNESPDVQMS